MILDEIKAAEQAKLQVLVNVSNIERDNTIQVLQHGLKRYEDITKKLVNRVETYRNEMEAYRNEVELYREEFGGRHLSKKELEKVEQILELMGKNPNTDDTEDAEVVE